MAAVSIPYTFVNNTQNADATQVNLNFTTLRDFLNGSVIHEDGTVSMTGMLTLSSTTPSDDNHATRKGYVDTKVWAEANLGAGAVTTAKIADNAVTSAKIAADTIVNSDINSAAAIAYSKLDLASSIVAADMAANNKIVEVGTAAARPTSGINNGRMYYASDTNRLYVGDGAEWHYVGGEGIWVNLARTTNQSIPNSTTTAVTWPTESNDTDNLHASSSATTTLTETGMYAVNYRIELEGTSVGFGVALEMQCGTGRVYKNTVPIVGASWASVCSGGFTTYFNSSSNCDVKLSVTNGTGASVTVTSANLEIRQIGR